MSREEELLEKGFRLAYFIIPDRQVAVQILSDARSKLGSRRSREKKRVYWRDKYLKGKITRMAREDEDLLQWLIYLESEDYERQLEQFTPPPLLEDMVVRYVKHLVEITTSMSSFYVNIGLYRLLHDYSTAEIRRTYEWVSEHFAGDEEYRAVKGALINRLQKRFEKFLTTCRMQRGEVRFEALEQQADWHDLVEECLSIFTPWSTNSCWVPKDFEPNAWTANKLLRKIVGSRDLDHLEMYRCHAFIDPCCYGRLAQGMGLDAPGNRLSVPKFFLDNEKSGRGNEEKSARFDKRRPNPAELTQQERGLIARRLEAETVERQQALPQVLYIVAHGEERARWDLSREKKHSLQIQDGTKLIEIWTECQGERVLLATHLVRYTRSQGIAESKHVVDLDGKRELLLHTIPGKGGAVVELECNALRDFPMWREVLNAGFSRPGVVARYALGLACLLLIGWVLGTIWQQKELAQQRSAIERVNEQLVQEKTARAALEHQLENQRSAQSLASFLLVSGTASIRGPEVAPESIVSISPNASVVNLRLPISQGPRQSYSAVLAPFMSEREILKQNFLEPASKTNGAEVNFLVPTPLLENGKRYVVTLYKIDKTGRQERVDLFTFYAVKK